MSLQLAQADLLNLVFDPEKLISSISSEHKTKYKRPGSSYSLHHWEKSPRESRNSHHLITQRDNMHSRAHDMCVDPRGHGTTCSKNRNIVPYHRCARIQRLMVSVPGYGSWVNVWGFELAQGRVIGPLCFIRARPGARKVEGGSQPGQESPQHVRGHQFVRDACRKGHVLAKIA